jgi:hypothetical protein
MMRAGIGNGIGGGGVLGEGVEDLLGVHEWILECNELLSSWDIGPIDTVTCITREVVDRMSGKTLARESSVTCRKMIDTA